MIKSQNGFCLVWHDINYKVIIKIMITGCKRKNIFKQLLEISLSTLMHLDELSTFATFDVTTPVIFTVAPLDDFNAFCCITSTTAQFFTRTFSAFLTSSANCKKWLFVREKYQNRILWKGTLSLSEDLFIKNTQKNFRGSRQEIPSLSYLSPTTRTDIFS